MTVNEATQTSAGLVQDGIALWNRQREEARSKKIQEQREVCEMIEKYWPWSTWGAKPRGLRNLRLEGLFPNNDFIKAKRLVSPLGLGRPGGGAPIVTHSGKKIVHTIEDPVLRFQWSKDLRKAVDNTLRYKTNTKERTDYKKQLDEQVTERRRREKREKHDDLVFHQRSFLKSPPWGKPGPGGTIWRPPGNIGINFLKSLGWSTENTLKALEKERQRYNTLVHGRPKENALTSEDKENVAFQCNSAPAQLKLSPLHRKKVNGVELVPLLAKQRAIPLKITLDTTDVTRGNPEKRRVPTPTYRKELINQMTYKKQRITEMKANDMKMARRHFMTLDNFWGRPGHGAPRSVIKKGCLNRLLHDHTVFAQ